jgi:hypothetical protein
MAQFIGNQSTPNPSCRHGLPVSRIQGCKNQTEQNLMPKYREKCFKRGGYNPLTNKVTVQFGDNSVYEYDGLNLNQWILWRDSYPRGVYFNHYYRYSEIRFTRLDEYPTNLWYEFIES